MKNRFKILPYIFVLLLMPQFLLAQDGKVKKIDTETFKKEIYDYDVSPEKFVFKGDKPVVVDFYADWCAPCKQISPILSELAEEYKGEVVFYKINTDHNKALARMFNVRSIPMILYIPKNGDPSYTVGGMNKDGFKELIDEHLLGKKSTK